MSATVVGDHCTCGPQDRGGVDPGCPRHGEHPCENAFRLPHAAGERGRGCCDHCVHIAGRIDLTEEQ